MGDILSQEEIDALLASVGAAAPSAPAPAAAPVAANSGAVSGGLSRAERLAAKQGDEKKVSLYDFRRPDRVSKDQMRVLQNLHEGFSRVLSTTLTSYLRTLIGSNEFLHVE